MKSRQKGIGYSQLWLGCFAAVVLEAAFLCLGAKAADYVSPSDNIVLPSETASQENLELTGARSTLRLGPFDFYPHASVTALYDDNILISHVHRLNDLEWTLAPGLTMASGDIAGVMPGPVTMEQLRGLMEYYSLGEDTTLPQRFLALDYSPGVNCFTEHSQFNNVDHLARLTGGYTFGHLSLALDQDFRREAIKDNTVNTRLTTTIYDTELRSRYNVNDRSAFDVDGRYHRFEYETSKYQGYQEFRNEDWYNRYLGGKLSLGLGAAFGFVDPDASPHQTYQQVLLRGTYQVTGKLDVRPSVGVEWRQFGGGGQSSVYPVFKIEGVYRPRETTVVTLEGHRHEEPSYLSDANYTRLGFSAGIRQTIIGRLTLYFNAGYEHIDYTGIADVTYNRSDDYVNARLGCDYEVNRRLTAGLYYIRGQDGSTEKPLSYDNNMVGARVTWRF